jgi:hypothetical protein
MHKIIDYKTTKKKKKSTIKKIKKMSLITQPNTNIQLNETTTNILYVRVNHIEQFDKVRRGSEVSTFFEKKAEKGEVKQDKTQEEEELTGKDRRWRERKGGRKG